MPAGQQVNLLKIPRRKEKGILNFFFQSIWWNLVSWSLHNTWNTFMKYFYFSIQHSLRMFLINKKIVFAEKRYRVKFNSIKKYMSLIKKKQKNSKRIWMKSCSKTRSYNPLQYTFFIFTNNFFFITQLRQQN